MKEKEKKMCYDLAIEENGFSPMDVDELLWINGGSTTISYEKEKTKTTNPDGSSEEHEKTTVSYNSDGPSIVDMAKKAWDAIKGLFNKGK